MIDVTDPPAQDPVQDYLKKYGGGQPPRADTSVADPAAAYLAKYPPAHESTAARVRPPQAPDNPLIPRLVDEPIPAYLAGHVLNAAQGVPGMTAVEALGGMLGSRVAAPFTGDTPLSYRESYNTLKDQTDQIGGATSFAEKALGGGALLGGLAAPAALGADAAAGGSRAAKLAQALVKTPARAGATLGATDALTNANPDVSVGRRLVEAPLAAGAGYALGGASDRITKAVASAKAPNAATNLVARGNARQDAGNMIYGLARGEARGREITPTLQAVLDSPDFAPIVDRIRAGRAGSGLDTPEFLGEVFEDLTAKQRGHEAVIARGDDAATGNIAARELKNVKAMKAALLNAMEASDQKPALSLNVPAETHTVAPREASAFTIPSRKTGGYLEHGFDPADYPTDPRTFTRATATDAPPGRAAIGPYYGDNGQELGHYFYGENGQELPEGLHLGQRLHPVQGPSGVRVPGVEVQTPAMRVQTAPAEPLPPTMPGYRAGPESYGTHSRSMDNVEYGQDLVRTVSGRGLPSGKNVDRQGPTAFSNFLSHEATPQDRSDNLEGILGAVDSRDKKIVPGDLLSAAQLKPTGAGSAARQKAAAIADLIRRARPQEDVNANRLLAALNALGAR